MVRLTETSLLFLLFLASSASGLVIKPVSEADINALVQEQIKSPVNRRHSEKDTCDPSCPYGWVKFNRRCFSYFGQAADWVTAEAYCINLGGNLASIHSENEYQVVKALIRAYDPSEKETWIGLSNCQKKDSWIWSDGTKFTYSRWNPNEPNHAGGECCVHINWDTSKNWNDYQCNIGNPFVCVKKL